MMADVMCAMLAIDQGHSVKKKHGIKLPRVLYLLCRLRMLEKTLTSALWANEQSPITSKCALRREMNEKYKVDIVLGIHPSFIKLPVDQ